MDKGQLRSLFISPASTIKDAIQRLNDTGLKILFVTDEREKLLGTLSDGDIRRGIIGGTAMTTTVDAVMRTQFLFLRAGSSDLAGEARRMMQKNLIEQVPVLSGEGIIEDVLLWVDFLIDRPATTAAKVPSLDNPVVIMAGGKGTRLDPFTKILPKPLIPIGDKPIIEHIMDRFHENGFSRFILIVNYKKEMIKAYFGDKALPYTVTFMEEEAFYGTAGGMSLLRGKIHAPFIVTNCDTILEGNYHDFLHWHRDHRNIMTIIGSHREITVPYGVLCMNNGVLDRIDEKPKLDLFINTGTYVFEPAVFDFIKDGQYLDMDALIRDLQGLHNDRVGVYPHWGGWFDIGQWDEYRKSLKELGNV